MKIICVGHNYDSHNLEMNRTSSEDDHIVIFLKPDSALLTNDKKQFYIPDFSSNIHYEVELVVKIDKMGKNIAQRFAYRYYSEITLGIDLTARDIQDNLKKKGLPWEISKGFDNSAVVGQFVPKEKYGKEINDLHFELTKNGQTVQKATTSDMIHSVDAIISYVSRFFTLKTGDLIFTGTPAGVGRVEINDYLQATLETDKLLDLYVC